MQWLSLEVLGARTINWNLFLFLTFFFLKTGEEFRLPVSADDYLSKLVEYGMMKLHAAAFVKETNQSWVEEDDFQVIMPKIDIVVRISKQTNNWYAFIEWHLFWFISKKVAGTAKIGQPLTVTFKLVNSLKTRLTSCKLHYEGPGLSRAEVCDCSDLPPGETMSTTIKLLPK